MFVCKTIRPNNTNNLSSKPTASQKFETTSSRNKEKLNDIEKRIKDMQDVIQLTKKKDLGKKMFLFANANSKSSSSTYSSLPTYPTIDSIISVSFKKPTFFSYSYSTYGESNHQVLNIF